jgi:hypothetical protein
VGSPSREFGVSDITRAGVSLHEERSAQPIITASALSATLGKC